MFSQAVAALADLGEGTDSHRKATVQHEPTQGVALPRWAVLGPSEYFLEDRHDCLAGAANLPRVLVTGRQCVDWQLRRAAGSPSLGSSHRGCEVAVTL